MPPYRDDDDDGDRRRREGSIPSVGSGWRGEGCHGRLRRRRSPTGCDGLSPPPPLPVRAVCRPPPLRRDRRRRRCPSCCGSGVVRLLHWFDPLPPSSCLRRKRGPSPSGSGGPLLTHFTTLLQLQLLSIDNSRARGAGTARVAALSLLHSQPGRRRNPRQRHMVDAWLVVVGVGGSLWCAACLPVAAA